MKRLSPFFSGRGAFGFREQGGVPGNVTDIGCRLGIMCLVPLCNVRARVPLEDCQYPVTGELDEDVLRFPGPCLEALG